MPNTLANMEASVNYVYALDLKLVSLRDVSKFSEMVYFYIILGFGASVGRCAAYDVTNIEFSDFLETSREVL